jgi:hypothetical protein
MPAAFLRDGLSSPRDACQMMGPPASPHIDLPSTPCIVLARNLAEPADLTHRYGLSDKQYHQLRAAWDVMISNIKAADREDRSWKDEVHNEITESRKYEDAIKATMTSDQLSRYEKHRSTSETTPEDAERILIHSKLMVAAAKELRSIGARTDLSPEAKVEAIYWVYREMHEREYAQLSPGSHRNIVAFQIKLLDRIHADEKKAAKK